MFRPHIRRAVVLNPTTPVLFTLPLSPIASLHYAQTAESGKRVEIFHYHYVWDGYFRSKWEEAKAYFKDIMVEPRADSGGTKFVTVLRDPIDHWLSYFYFYREPEMEASPPI